MQNPFEKKIRRANIKDPFKKEIVRVNLNGIINDQYNNLEEEESDIIISLLKILDRKSDILIGDVFCVLVPGNRIYYYNIFKNFYPITKKEYNQYLKRNTPKPQVDYSNRNYHRVYNPNKKNSLLDLEDELIKDLKHDHSIQPDDVIEVNIGGEKKWSPIIVYYKVVRGVLHVDEIDLKKSILAMRPPKSSPAPTSSKTSVLSLD